MNPIKMTAVAVLAAFLSVSLPASQEKGGAGDSTPAEKRPFGPLEKSLLLPGWGQFSEGRIVEGAFFLGSTALGLIGALRNNHLGNENYALYKAATGQADVVRFRALTERYDRRRNQFFLAGAAAWALNLLDIALIVKDGDRTRRAWTMRIGCDANEAFVVGAAYRF
jgi:hypothetical protein